MGEHPVVSTTGGKLSAEDIAANFDDLHLPLNAEQVSVEASRCLFCHDAPCVTACPTSIDIPKFIRQIATGNLTGSARTILSANIMGGTCARACPTEILCESKCVLNTGEHDPIEIGALQRHAVDHLIARNDPHPFTRAKPSGKNIAVIGAGPAGLACAHALAVHGHEVEIFEAREKPGGLNEYGLAAYKMVDDFAAREVDFILGVGGITLHYGEALGRDVAFTDLQARFDAVFMGIGLGAPRKMGIDGEHLDGVMNALQFIENIRQTDDPAQIYPGENVVIIGGGNTAIDAAVQAKRLGARSVTLVYRRGGTQMGATEWEQDLAAVNGVTLTHWAKPVRLTGKGTVNVVEFERTALKDGALEGTGEHFTFLADRVYAAIGQELYDQGLANITCEHGKIMVDEAGQTSLPGVFAGGDCIASGEDLTVQAVEDGKNAAAGIDTFLRGNNG
ncbi:MAG: dihydropyrimidine dehydrogenase [Robiginitomaculum sp.]|nr:MAG: dihydropyrimidine dehydrogenase [Robiginitomaculum sp.]